MRRFLIPILIAATFILASTYAGMTLFGMTMNTDECMGTACHSMPDAGTAGMNCLNHCLGALPTSSIVTPFSFLVAFGFAVSALLLLQSFATISRTDWIRNRTREGIGKMLLHQSLSTIILRN